jgi:serine/threonine protein kinase
MTNKDSDLIGKTIGNYKIISKLGSGGMAVVYKAHELSLNRIVALKVLSSHLSENNEFIKRFEREARAAAKLNHPNIIQIYAIGEEEGIHFFSMEYVKGKTLAEIIEEEKKLTYDKAIPIIIQTAEALSEAHKHGIVHRDMKPSNIMVNNNGTVKVTDFGIAYVSQETKLTKSGSIIGTPEYLSPEQCEAKTIDNRSDIYSLGVTFYELLSGKTPYKADTPVSMLLEIVKGNFPPLNEVNPDIPEFIQKIVEKMMQTKPEDRFNNANELIESLKKHMEKSISTKDFEKEKHIERLYEPEKRKNRGLKFAGVFIVILIICAGAFFALKYFKKDKNIAIETTSVSSSVKTDTNTANPSQNNKETIQEKILDTGYQNQNDSKSINSNESNREIVKSGDSLGLNTNMKSDLKQIKPPKHKKKIRAITPPSNSVVITAIGNDNKADLISSITHEILSNNNFHIIDRPSVENEKLSKVARFHLVLTENYLGSTTLSYYGSTSELLSYSITIKVISTKNNSIIAGPFNEIAKFTSLNIKENLTKAIKKLIRKILKKIN